MTWSTSLFVVLVFGAFLGVSHGMEAHWSVCDQYYAGNCRSGRAYDDCTFEHLKPTGVSVKGLWIFFAEGRSNGPNGTGLAEFVFQERFGDYTLLTETSGNISCLKRMGGEDYRTPTITVVNELSLISDGAIRYTESFGSVDNCMTSYTIKSFAVNGAERWELIGRNGTSVCVQVEDTLSLIPGIVRDTRTLGFDHELSNICAVVRGCSKPPSEVVKIPNYETQGVLRR